MNIKPKLLVLALASAPFTQSAQAADLYLEGASITNFWFGAMSYDWEYIGYWNGDNTTFIQFGGTNSVNYSLSLGERYGSNGTYNLSGTGSLSAPGENIGTDGTGTFNQSGGSNTLGSTLYLGVAGGSNGTYNLNGPGNLSADLEYIGDHGVGTFNQSGGTNTVAYNLYTGLESGSNGTYNLSGAGSLTANGEYIGMNGTGTFNQSGGTNTVGSDGLNLGHGGINGAYTLSGGILNVGAIAGSLGSSTFNLDGGKLNFAANGSIKVSSFVIDYASGSNGSFTLTSGQSVTTGSESIGVLGAGTFNQSGGTSTVANHLYLGIGSGSSGSYNLSGGILNVGSIADGSGHSTFNFDGGTLNLAANGSIKVSEFGIGMDSSFTLTSGQTVTTGSESIGVLGAGTFNQSGGTNTVANLLYLGDISGSNSTYNLSGGTLNVGGIQGANGNSIFKLDGGTLNLAAKGSINVSDFDIDRASSLTLISGQNVTVGYESIGVLGTATFNQSGGTNTVASHLYLGYNSGSNGTYNLSGNGSLSAGDEYIGVYGTSTGAFNQSGGTNTVNSGALHLGYGSGSWGTYTLSGGILNVGAITGGTGYSEFNLDGGTLNLAANGSINVSSFVIDYASGSNGSFTLANGQTVTDRYEYIGFGGTGIFYQNGGTNTVANAFYLGNDIGSSGTYILRNGNLSASAEFIGNNSIGGTFKQTGGTNTVGALTIDSGSYSLSGGKLKVNTSLTNNDTFVLAGGSITGSGALVNNGLMNGYGVIAGSGGMTNNGTITLSGDTMVNSTVTNAVSSTLQVSHSAAVFSNNVVNDGLINTANAKVAFAGGLTENGALVSDHSTSTVTDLIIGVNGYLTGGSGDVWQVSGNFLNYSTQNTLWNTSVTTLILNGTSVQDFYLAGSNLGASISGYSNNLAWGVLELSKGVQMDVTNTNGAALYVGVLQLAGGIGQLANIHSASDIYYIANLAGNAYLGGQNYALAGGGELIAVATVPLPASWVFMLSGFGLFGSRAHGKSKALCV